MPHKFLTPRQRQQLHEELRAPKDARVYRRALALLEIDRGRPVTEVAQSLGLNRRCLYGWMDRASRPTIALEDRPRSGRPSRWTPALHAHLHAALEGRPDVWGYRATAWTVPLLRAHLARVGGCTLSEDTIRRELARSDYVWKRPRYVLTPDPAREKKRRIRELVRRRGKRVVVLAQDATDLLLFPPLRACWAKRGADAEVELRGGNAKRVLFGAMDLHTGRRLLLVRERQRGADFQAFLRHVRRHCGRRRVLMLLDTDSSHTAHASVALAAELTIELVWLPIWCLELNPIDHLWRLGKQRICANRQHAHIEDLVEDYVA